MRPTSSETPSAAELVSAIEELVKSKMVRLLKHEVSESLSCLCTDEHCGSQLLSLIPITEPTRTY